MKLRVIVAESRLGKLTPFFARRLLHSQTLSSWLHLRSLWDMAYLQLVREHFNELNPPCARREEVEVDTGEDDACVDIAYCEDWVATAELKKFHLSPEEVEEAESWLEQEMHEIQELATSRLGISAITCRVMPWGCDLLFSGQLITVCPHDLLPLLGKPRSGDTELWNSLRQLDSADSMEDEQ